MRQDHKFVDAEQSISSPHSAGILENSIDQRLSIERDAEKGLILVARERFEPGQIISAAPAIELSHEERLLLKPHVAYRYVFINPQEIAAGQKQMKGYLVFGPVSFCSHSDEPNAEVRWSFDDGLLLVRLIAVEHIAPRGEITMSYANLEDYPDRSSWV